MGNSFRGSRNPVFIITSTAAGQDGISGGWFDEGRRNALNPAHSMKSIGVYTLA